MGEVLGAWLKQRRNKLNWGQGDLAERAGVSQSMVSRIERGQMVPGPQDARRIARALGTYPGELFAALLVDLARDYLAEDEGEG